MLATGCRRRLRREPGDRLRRVLPCGVAVTWPDRKCAGSTCSYQAATLVSNAINDPVFTANETAKPPVVTNPGARVGEVSVPVNLQLGVTGGAPPLTWSGSGLPDGLSILSSGLITGAPTVAGTYPVTVRATAGVAPYTWTGTGLPTGLSISSTGVISGKPTEGTRYIVGVTVTDGEGTAVTVSFVWTVAASGTSLQITAPTGDRTGDRVGQYVSFTATASGGGSGYTWTATGLPPGAAVSVGGMVSGLLTRAGTYTTQLTATSSTGKVATYMFTWTVQ